MTKEEIKREVDTLVEIYDRISNCKTKLLEIQGVLTDSEEYQMEEEEFDRIFEELDDNLYYAKNKILSIQSRIIDNLCNKR